VSQKTSYSGSTVVLTVWGDSIVGWALVLLLRGSGYQTTFLPALPSGEPLLLEGTQLLVLTPTPQLSTNQREALLVSLRETPESAAIPVLELRVPSEETQEEGGLRDDSWHHVPWPCRLEELEQRIEAALWQHLRPKGGVTETQTQQTKRGYWGILRYLAW
jgi:hypothetical protein